MKLNSVLNKLLLGTFVVFGYSSRGLAEELKLTCDDESVILGFTGDVLVHDALYKSILSNKSFSKLWRKSEVLFQKAHHMTVNLEGPAALGVDKSGQSVGDVGFTYDLNVYSGTKFVFNFHPQILSDLKNSGVDQISTANNHSLDRGSLGVTRTLEAAARVGLHTVGTRKVGAPWMDFARIESIQGHDIAFVACTESTNGLKDPKKQVLPCNQEVARLIEELKQKEVADAIVVLPHWGEEYKNRPNERQRSLARLFLEKGATAVIGSHPHVLQPWETYTTKDGRRTLIAYSLGNFLAFQAGLEKKTGVVIYLKLQQGESGALDFKTAYYTPTIREGFEVLPVTSPKSDAAKEAAKYFGDDRRLGVKQTPTNCYIR